MTKIRNMRYLQLGSNLSQVGGQFQGQGLPTSASNDHKILNTVLQQRRTRKQKQQAVAVNREASFVIRETKPPKTTAVGTSTNVATSVAANIKAEKGKQEGQEAVTGE